MEKESLFARFKRHRTEKKINRLKELFAFLIESNKQEQASSVALLQQHQEYFISSKLEKFEQNLTNSFSDLNTHVKELRQVLTQVNESSVEGKEELGHRLSSLINNLEEKSSALQESLAKTSQEETAHKIIRIAENLGTQLSGINQDSTDAFSALAQKIDNSLDVLKVSQASSVALLQQHQEYFISSKLEKFEQNLTNSFSDLNTHVKELRQVLTQVNESSVEGKEELGHRLSSLINNLEEKSSALQESLAKTSQEETAHKIIRIAENLGTQLSGINQDSTDAFSALAQKIDNSLDVLKVSQESSVAQLQKHQESLLNSTEDNLKHYVTNSFDEVKTNLDTVGSTLENIKDNAAEYKNELAQLLSSISQKIENKSEILKSCISNADQGNKVNDIIKVLHKIDSQLTAVQRSNQHNFEDLKGNLNERVSGIKLGIGDIQALIKIIAVNNLIDEINVKKK